MPLPASRNNSNTLLKDKLLWNLCSELTGICLVVSCDFRDISGSLLCISKNVLDWAVANDLQTFQKVEILSPRLVSVKAV